MFFPNGLYNRFKNHDRIVTEDFELNAPRMIFHSDVFIYQRSIAEWLIWRFDGWIIPAALPRAGVLWFWVGVNFSGVVSVLWLLFTQSPSVKTLKQTAPGSHSLNLHYVPHPEGGACESECVFDSKVSLQRIAAMKLLQSLCKQVFQTGPRDRGVLILFQLILRQYKEFFNTFVCIIWV